jgi:hypothetical protein
MLIRIYVLSRQYGNSPQMILFPSACDVTLFCGISIDPDHFTGLKMISQSILLQELP